MTSYRRFSERSAEEDFFGFFEDFETYTATDWVITTTEAGAGSATEAIDADAVGGVLVVTNDDADNDKDMFQRSADGGTTPAEQFKFTSGKRLQYRFRGKLSDATDSDFFAGLYVTDTDPVGGIVDGVYFRKDDGDTELDAVVIKDSVSSVQEAVADLADDTYVELEIWYDGASTIEFWVDGVRVAGLPITNMPDDEEVAASFGIQNGAAAAKVLSVDYIGARQER